MSARFGIREEERRGLAGREPTRRLLVGRRLCAVSGGPRDHEARLKWTLTRAYGSGHGSLTALTLTAMGRLPKVLPAIR